MRYSYHRWPDRAAWEAAAAEAGWPLDVTGVPHVAGLDVIAGLAPVEEEAPPDPCWHLVLATDDALPASIAAAEHPATDAPFWWAGVPREMPQPAAPAIPDSLTFRQFILALWMGSLITEEEALAAAETRARPAAFEQVLAALPSPDATAARITWATMTVVPREHPLIGALVLAGVATQAQIDAVFVAGAAVP